MLQLLKQHFCLIFEYNSNKLNKDEAASSACRDQRLFVKRSSCPGATAVPEFTARPRGRTGEPRAGETFLDQRISSCRRASTSHTTETPLDQGVELLQATCVCLRRRPEPLMWDQPSASDPQEETPERRSVHAQLLCSRGGGATNGAITDRV